MAIKEEVEKLNAQYERWQTVASSKHLEFSASILEARFQDAVVEAWPRIAAAMLPQSSDGNR